MSVIDRLLDEAEKAQRKGHLLLAEVCRDAADELGLVIEERNRLRQTLAAAAVPLEAMILGGTDKLHSEEMQESIRRAVVAIRTAIMEIGHE
jgi:hypothetical protein